MPKSAPLSPVRRFLNLLKVDRQDILSVYLYALFNGIISLSLPLGIQAITNFITGGQSSTSWIVLVVFVVLGLAFSGVLQIMQLTVTENLQRKIFTRSSFEFAYRIPRLKLEGVSRQYVPELVNRFFDTLSVQKGLSKILIDFSSASLSVLFGLVLLSLYHPFFIMFGLVLVSIVFLIFYYTARRGLRTSLQESKYKYEVAYWLEELGRAMETFKLAGNSPLALSRTDEGVERYLGARKAHFKTLITQFINLVGFKVVIAAGLLLIGGFLVINGQMNIGQFVASEIVIILVLNSVEKLILSMETIYDVLTSVEKIGAVADLDLERHGGSTIEANGPAMGIQADNITYKFFDSPQPILNGVSLQVKPGEHHCLSGGEGSGKSFFLQVLAGLFTEFEGTLSFDGIPLGNWHIGHFRSMIGDSLTREDIFRGTVAENISVGKPGITLNDVRDAAHVVGLNRFIQTLPEGYNTELQPEGSNLPKSIRLKIMLARAITGKPRLILLEDSFNRLPKEDCERFLNHLLDGEWTAIVVSNDPNVARRFDRVTVMEHGRLVACGNFDDVINVAPWITTPQPA